MYIGKLTRPFRKINEGSTEHDHLDFDAEQVVQFVYADKNHQFLVDKLLRQD